MRELTEAIRSSPARGAQASVDAAWDEAMGILEDAFRSTATVMATANPEDPDWQQEAKGRGGRDKSTRPSFNLQGRPWRDGARGRVHHAVAKLRKLVSRLGQLMRHNTRPAARERLLQKVDRADKKQGQSLGSRWNAARKALEKAEKQDKERRLRTWRERMQDFRQAARWIKDDGCCCPKYVFDGTTCTTSAHSQMLEAIAAFWRRIRDRPLPDLPAAAAAIRDDMGAARADSPWQPTPPKLIVEAALRQAGSGAGPDGWSGSELALIPFCVLRDIAVLLQAVEAAGVVPRSWCYARQVHIPKPGKGSEDGGWHLDNLRPITIFSARYRVLL